MKIFYNCSMLSLSICFCISCSKDMASGEKEDAETIDNILYPGVQKASVVKSEYDKWMLSSGRKLTGDKGQGLKDGSKAAVNAFVNR
ncbi:MAG: hypothetical protein NC308_00610 [Clostridium sp.]|nr:hypothetical protein [Bacteroides sp.]MCM1197366.1 hypothetical protein [Clostridium sp.]